MRMQIGVDLKCKGSVGSWDGGTRRPYVAEPPDAAAGNVQTCLRVSGTRHSKAARLLLPRGVKSAAHTLNVQKF